MEYFTIEHYDNKIRKLEMKTSQTTLTYFWNENEYVYKQLEFKHGRTIGSLSLEFSSDDAIVKILDNIFSVDNNNDLISYVKNLIKITGKMIGCFSNLNIDVTINCKINFDPITDDQFKSECTQNNHGKISISKQSTIEVKFNRYEYYHQNGKWIVIKYSKQFGSHIKKTFRANDKFIEDQTELILSGIITGQISSIVLPDTPEFKLLQKLTTNKPVFESDLEKIDFTCGGVYPSSIVS